MALPSVTPKFSDTEIQKMQDLEQAQLERAYELGKAEMQPSEDCISREAVNKAINKWLSSPYYDYGNYIYEMTKTIHKLPSVKPQRAKGHWSDECECSVCGNQPWYEGSTFRKNYKFCPYCGADMRGDSNDD